MSSLLVTVFYIHFSYNKALTAASVALYYIWLNPVLKRMRKACCLVYGILHLSVLQAQVHLRGMVYIDSVQQRPADSAMLYVSTGRHWYTNRQGMYSIDLPVYDTLFIFYQHKILALPINAAVLRQPYLNIYLNDTAHGRLAVEQLKPVFVKSNYKEDSINNRRDYDNIFNYRKPTLASNNKWKDSTNGIPLNTQNKKLGLVSTSIFGIGRTGKQKQHLQKRLVANEQLNYVANWFRPALVQKYCDMRNKDSLNFFVIHYTPAYKDFIAMNEIDLAQYIIKQVKVYRGEVK